MEECFLPTEPDTLNERGAMGSIKSCQCGCRVWICPCRYERLNLRKRDRLIFLSHGLAWRCKLKALGHLVGRGVEISNSMDFWLIVQTVRSDKSFEFLLWLFRNLRNIGGWECCSIHRVIGMRRHARARNDLAEHQELAAQVTYLKLVAKLAASVKLCAGSFF